MTVVAGVAACYVSRVLTACSDPIMAGATGSQNLCVINGDHGLPHIGRVAVLADICRLNVRRAFAGRRRSVMAANTISDDVHVIEIRRQPGNRGVTVVAGIAARDVSRVLTDRSDAVMAGATGSQNLCVINGHYGLPHIRGVAIIANICRLNVCGAFAGRVRAVMAAKAISDDVHVIEVRR